MNGFLRYFSAFIVRRSIRAQGWDSLSVSESLKTIMV
jgi:hypothetical protein